MNKAQKQSFHISRKRLRELMDAIFPQLKDHKITNEEFVALFGERLFWAASYDRYDAFKDGITRQKET